MVEAIRLWDIYREVAQPGEVQRLGVRFINRIDVPIHELDLDDYFTGLGKAPGGLPWKNFLYRNELSVPDKPYDLSVTRTLQRGEKESSEIGLILDTDVFAQGVSSSELTTESERWQEIRRLKNLIFFESFTPRALELCK